MTRTPSAAPRTRPAFSPRALLSQYGVILAMVVTFVVFSVMRPDSFFTPFMMQSILRDTVPLMILALGVTFVLVMNTYDLSVGGLTALVATSAVMFVSTTYLGLSPWIGVPLALGLGTLLGAFNGVMIAYVGLPSFIFTIAMGTVFTGMGLQLTNSSSIYSGIPPDYIAIARSGPFGLSNQVYIGLIVLVVAHLFLRHSQPGRYMYAVGGNPEAARLSGVPVRFLRALGYSLVGLMAAMTAILMTSQAGAANPNTGVGLLLPAYAAAFLGSSMFRPGSFTAIGTALGALFLQIIGSGLTVLNLSGSLIQLIQGAILALAVLLAQLNRKAH